MSYSACPHLSFLGFIPQNRVVAELRDMNTLLRLQVQDSSVIDRLKVARYVLSLSRSPSPSPPLPSPYWSPSCGPGLWLLGRAHRLGSIELTIHSHAYPPRQAENAECRQQIAEMEEFLRDYGMQWVGRRGSALARRTAFASPLHIQSRL